MERISLEADEIYARVIKELKPDTTLFYYYLNPWDCKVKFHGSPKFITAFKYGRVKEMTLLLLIDDLYTVINYTLYKTTFNKRKRNPYDL